MWIDLLPDTYNDNVKSALAWLTGDRSNWALDGEQYQSLVHQETCLPRCNKFKVSARNAPPVLQSWDLAVMCSRAQQNAQQNAGLGCLDYMTSAELRMVSRTTHHSLLHARTRNSPHKNDRAHDQPACRAVHTAYPPPHHVHWHAALSVAVRADLPYREGP